MFILTTSLDNNNSNRTTGFKFFKDDNLSDLRTPQNTIVDPKNIIFWEIRTFLAKSSPKFWEFFDRDKIAR
jgi:hypothetical protein